MGPIKVSPTCDITDTIKRGTVSVETYYENRLGTAVGVLCRNGVNVLIPPSHGKSVATGVFEIYVQYRCVGKAQLNQYSSFFEMNPKFVEVGVDHNLNDTVLKLVYRLTMAELRDSDTFYIDALDITLVLNPMYGMPAHARDMFVDKRYAKLKEVLLNSPTTVRIGVPYDTTHVNIILAGVVVKLAAFKTNGPVVASTCHYADGELRQEACHIDPRFVFPDTERARAEAEKVESTLAHKADIDVFSENYFDRLSGSSIDTTRRDLTKELSNLSDALDKVNNNARAEELARIKHAQAMGGEGLKVLTATSNLGARILDILS